MNFWEKGIGCLSAGLTAAVLVKLWLNGLIRVYKLFFCYLLWDFLSAVVGLSIRYNTDAYGRYYFTAQTVKIVIGAFVLVEIYSLALERTQALAQFGRRVVGYILGAAAIPAVIALFTDRGESGESYPYLRLYLLFERTMTGTAAIFLILISLFMAWFPVRLRRNVILYIWGFVVWSLTRAAAVHLTTLFPKHLVAIRVISALQISIGLACLLFWLLGFKREGEVRTAVVGHLWNRAEAERLTDQLDAINNSLERLRRR